MTNLTEQWKKGKLPSGWYWVKMSYQGAKILLYYSEDYGFEYDGHFYDFEEISEVLGRVPSYEEWQETEKRSWLVPEFDNEIDELNDTIEELEKENAQLKKWCEEFNALEVAEENTKLKELLKECKHIIGIEKDFASCHFEKDKLCQLLTKIAQVLGEE